MAQITSNQRSYTNYAALLNVSATAKRTGANTVSITAEWSIYTSASALDSATRYLVLFVESEEGKKYYSPNYIRSGAWAKNTTYSGTVIFTGVALSAGETSIKIGFGVSQANTYVTSSGTLIWNGDCSWTIGTYNPYIQFNTITGIAQGYTACTAPTSFTVSPDVFKDAVELSWSGAKGGTNNSITGFEIQYATSTDGATWSQWGSVGVAEVSPISNTPDIELGMYQKFRIRTLGSAESSYHSGWVESNIVRRAKPVMHIYSGAALKTYGAYIYNGTEKKRHTPYLWDGSKWVQSQN